jgi:signal peptidase I
MQLKKYWRKFWHLLWVDESLKGWIFAFVFLFIFIKLIFFPTLNFLTGTPMSLAIVESCSMYHETEAIFFHDFDKWWETHKSKYDITKEEFKDFKLHNGFNKGDILFAIRAKPEKLEIGNILLFDSGRGHPIIHRIINIRNENEEYFFTTIGDNNPYSFTSSNNPFGISEINIKEDQLVGKAVFKIAPYLGWGKLIFYDFRKSESEQGLCHEN